MRCTIHYLGVTEHKAPITESGFWTFIIQYIVGFADPAGPALGDFDTLQQQGFGFSCPSTWSVGTFKPATSYHVRLAGLIICSGFLFFFIWTLMTKYHGQISSPCWLIQEFQVVVFLTFLPLYNVSRIPQRSSGSSLPPQHWTALHVCFWLCFVLLWASCSVLAGSAGRVYHEHVAHLELFSVKGGERKREKERQENESESLTENVSQ